MASTSTATDSGFAAQNTSWVVLLVVILFLSITTILVGLRLYTRVFLIKQLGWDDYSVMVTLVIIAADAGAILSTVPYGLGRHTSTLDTSMTVPYLRNFWLSIILYNLTLSLVKLTFLLQYYRVLSVHKMKKVIWTLGILIMLWALSQLFVVVFTCVPVQKFWYTDLPGHCMPNLPFWYINAAGNIATDLAIFIMPLPVLKSLQLRKKQKYFLMGIFSLGFFTSAISLIRLAYLKQGPDYTFDNVPTACWSFTELCGGIICACLPTLRPLMLKIKPSWMTSYATRRARQDEYAKAAHYGPGTLGNTTEAKSTVPRQSRHARDSIHTLSTMNKNYSRLKDDDIERAMREPMPPSPAYTADFKGSGTASSGDLAESLDGEEGFQMQELQSRLKPQAQRVYDHSKVQEVLGMGVGDNMGVSTQVTGGRISKSYAESMGPKAISSMPGIEVKRQVTVTTSDV